MKKGGTYKVYEKYKIFDYKASGYYFKKKWVATFSNYLPADRYCRWFDKEYGLHESWTWDVVFKPTNKVS